MQKKGLNLFYKGNKLSTLLADDTYHVIVNVNNQNLCETSSQISPARLLATDLQGSTITILSKSLTNVAYDTFGRDNLPPASSLLSRFNGAYWSSEIKGYLLGNGQRLLNTSIMRFCSADDLSPFGKGGINAYCYCGNDPINNSDPSGHFFFRTWRKSRAGTLPHQLYEKLEHMQKTRNNLHLEKNKINSFSERQYLSAKRLMGNEYQNSVNKMTEILKKQETIPTDTSNMSSTRLKELDITLFEERKPFEELLNKHFSKNNLFTDPKQFNLFNYRGKTRYFLPADHISDIRISSEKVA